MRIQRPVILLTALFALYSLASVRPVLAQNARGTLLGHVADPSGAAIPGAKVSYRNVATGVSGTFITTSDGDYVFVNLVPGTYNVTCEARGFKVGVSNGLVVQVDHTLRQDFKLQIGQVSQQITVSGRSQMLQTDNATIGGVVTDHLMQALPISGRDFTNLIALNAGVSQAAGGIQTSVFDQHGLNNTWRAPSVDGSRPGSISYLIDGITDNSMFFTTASNIPSEYSVQEFKLQNGLYSAAYGSGAAQVNVAIRSGTNKFHGNVYDFMENGGFQPSNQLNETLNALHGTHLPTSDPLKQQNQFGGTIGGPIRHDRVFFFGSYEGGRRNTTASAVSMQVPTDAERSGNFSDWPYPIYDPSTTTVTGTNPTTISRQQFSGNVITSGISPVAQKLLAFYPHANVNCTMPCTNFIGDNPPSSVDTDTVTGRLDANLSDRDRLFFTGVIWRDNAPSPSVIPVNSTVVFTHSGLYGLDWEHSFGATMTNEARVGYDRTFFHEGASSAFGPNLAAQLGLSNTPNVAAFYNIPIVSPTQGYTGIGSGNNGYTQTDNTFQFVDNLNFIRGKHTFTLGADIRRIQLADRDGFSAEGTLRFNGAYTGLDPSASASGRPGPTAGNPIADLLLGDPISTGAPAPIASDIYDLRGTSYSFFGEDDLRLTPRLTLNLGLRWEIPPDLHSTSNSGAILNPHTPGGGLIWASKSFVDQVAPALTSAQQSTYMQCCVTNQLVPRDMRDFAPRIGLAWRPLSTNRLVVRAGYGIFYDVYMRFYDGTNYDSNSLYTVTAPSYPTATGFESVSPLAFSGLWLAPIIGNPFPSLLATPYLFGPQTEWPNNHTPYSQQWGLDTQYALNQNTMLDIGYVGQHGIHEPIQWHFNEAYPPPVAGDACNYLQDASQATGSNAGCASDPNFVPIDQRAPFANLYTRSYANANILSSYYNALQVRLDERMYHGLGFMANYTYSKTMDMNSEIATFSNDPGGQANFVQDAHNLRADYAPADFNQTHRLSLSYSYQLPLGKGRTWSLGRANWVVGGWNTSGILTFASGLPESVFCCSRIPDQFGNLFGSRIRANVSGSPTSGITQTDLQWINPAVFSVPTPGTYGNSGRNIVRVPGQRQADIAFVKDTPITEHQDLQFRLEIFNLFSSTHTGQHFFNSGVYQSPANCTPGPSGNCAFGSLVPLNGAGALNFWNPRILQMALVYSF
jgi:Carboxypeptidase regulatory-like domain/TonB dependent receptor-like, beta-barrel